VEVLVSGFVRREGDRKVATHLHEAVEHLVSAGAAAREGAFRKAEVGAIWTAKDSAEDAIEQLGGGEFENLAMERHDACARLVTVAREVCAYERPLEDLADVLAGMGEDATPGDGT